MTDREVLEENYGGGPLYGVVPNTRGDLVKRERLATAYMLVYIRESAIDEVLAPLTEEDIPPRLSKLLLGRWLKFLVHPSRRTKI